MKDNVNRYIPNHVGTNSNWLELAGGYGHSLGRLADGSLWAWGLNNYGQLGMGDTANRNIPTLVRIPRPLPEIYLLLMGN